MKFVVVRLSCLILVLHLTGCGLLVGENGVFQNHANDYLKTGSIKEITLPEGMSSTNLMPIYSIPDVNVTDEFGDAYSLVEYEIPLPNPLNTDKNSVGVKLQKLNDDRWIFVKASPAQVWPRTQNFLSEYGMRVSKSDPSSGIIETDWVTFRDDESMRSRFKLILEKGIHQETTEVHVLQVEVPVANIDLAMPDWPSKSLNIERENWLIDNLSQELAKNIDNSSASLLGLNVGGELKARFTKKYDEPAIHIRLSTDRAWATLLHSARQEAFRSWESNEAKGLIYLDYSDELLKERGFFSKLAFWNRPKLIPEKANYPLDQILAHLSDSDDVRSMFDDIAGTAYAQKLPKSQGYILLIKHEPDGSYVYLRDYRGRKLPVDEAKLKLRMLRKNLI